MTEALSEAPNVAKKKTSKSESRRYNTLVRLDDDMVAQAKKVVALKGTNLAEYFTAILKPVVSRDWAKELKKAKEDEESKRHE